jgi:hypothetical protein
MTADTIPHSKRLRGRPACVTRMLSLETLEVSVRDAKSCIPSPAAVEKFAGREGPIFPSDLVLFLGPPQTYYHQRLKKLVVPMVQLDRG